MTTYGRIESIMRGRDVTVLDTALSVHEEEWREPIPEGAVLVQWEGQDSIVLVVGYTTDTRGVRDGALSEGEGPEEAVRLAYDLLREQGAWGDEDPDDEDPDEVPETRRPSRILVRVPTGKDWGLPAEMVDHPIPYPTYDAPWDDEAFDAWVWGEHGRHPAAFVLHDGGMVCRSCCRTVPEIPWATVRHHGDFGQDVPAEDAQWLVVGVQEPEDDGACDHCGGGFGR